MISHHSIYMSILDLPHPEWCLVVDTDPLGYPVVFGLDFPLGLIVRLQIILKFVGTTIGLWGLRGRDRNILGTSFQDVDRKSGGERRVLVTDLSDRFVPGEINLHQGLELENA